MRKPPWTRRAQRDWGQLPCAEVDWLVVWNVNLGAGGDEAFGTKYSGKRLPFRPWEVTAEAAWVWVADGEAVPSDCRDHRPTGGIYNGIHAVVHGVPIDAGVVVVLPDAVASPLEHLTATFAATIGPPGHAWCPAVAGYRSGPRPAVSVQSSHGSTGIRLGVAIGADELLIVDPFGERGTFGGSSYPKILVTGTPEGTRRRARSGMDGFADVVLPEWLATRRYPAPWWLT